MNYRINHLAVLLLVVVAQLIGAAWYSETLFAHSWLRYHGKTMAEINDDDFSPFIISIIASIVVFYALAWLFTRLNVHSAFHGLCVALICWFAFLFVDYATIEAFSAFGRNYCQIIFIDMGRTFLTFAVGGLVLGAWRKQRL